MRKDIIKKTARDESAAPQRPWLKLAEIARVEISSEDSAHPIEHAFNDQLDTYWRAGQPGQQTIRLIFDTPQKVNDVRLCFIENQISRTQEYVLRWSPDGGQTHFEIVRQQWNFSPEGSRMEVADYHVNLTGVRELELLIDPEIAGKEVYATLADLRLA